MASRVSRLSAYYQAAPKSSLSWRPLYIQPNIWRYAQSNGERRFHKTAYMYAKKRPASSIVKPHAKKMQPVTPERKPLPSVGTSQSTSATAVPDSGSVITQETQQQPTDDSSLSETEPVVSEVKASPQYKSPTSDILESLKRNQNIPITDRNAGILAAALDSKPEPTVLFQSSPQTQFALVSYSSCTFMFWAGYMNSKTYEVLAANSLWMSSVGYLASAIFVMMGIYLAAAPQKMIKSITAIPSRQSSKLKRQPLLRVEFVQIFPGIKFSPVELPVSSVLRMHRISDKVNYIEAARAQEIRRSNVGNGFFDRVRLLLQDFKKMWDRRHYMGYLRIRGGKGLIKGTWKLDLSDAKVEHQGKVLDLLLAKDWNPPRWRRSLRYTDSRED